MAGYRSISPNITSTTESAQLRIELQNTFSRLDGTLASAPYKIFTQNGPVSNTGSDETDLMSYTIEQGTLSQLGSSILIFACGNTNANANNKTLNLKLGATTLFTTGAVALNNIDWVLQAEVVFAGGTAQISYAVFNRNGGSPIINTTTATENFANSLTIKITGTGVATGDIDCTYWKGMLLK